LRPTDSTVTCALVVFPRSLTWEVRDLGNTTKAQVTVESVGRNGVKRVVDALVRLTTTDRAVERIFTIHTKLFARYQHRIPAFKFLQTFVIDELQLERATWLRPPAR